MYKQLLTNSTYYILCITYFVKSNMFLKIIPINFMINN